MIINNIYKIFSRAPRVMLFMVFLGMWGMANGQQAESISAFLQEAALNNPGLKAKYSAYAAALERVPQAGALPDPELQFGLFIRPMELLGGSQVADFRLMQMSPWFGTLKAAKDEASKMAQAKYEEALSARDELYFQVRRSYYLIYRTREEIKVAEENLALLKSLERMALVRYKAAESPAPEGSKGLVNLLRVQIETGALENRIALLNDQLVTDQARFNSTLNRKPESDVFISDSLMEIALPGSLALLADSLVNNPKIKMYEADQAANEARINMVTRMGYPMIGAGLDYSLIRKRPDANPMMNGKDMIMPMITATLPIYRKKYNAMRREAEFLRDAASESAVNIRNDLSVQYLEAIQQYNDADRRFDLFRRQASLAEKSIKLLTASFSAAGSDFEEILRMQQQLLEYQFNQIEALVDRNIAVAVILSLISQS